MKKPAIGNSKRLPITSPEEIRQVAGPVDDHTIADILALMPTIDDVEVAVVYAQGEGDTVGAEGHGLMGKAARVYEILTEDDVYQFDERSPDGAPMRRSS
jgi:hypothetical protein